MKERRDTERQKRETKLSRTAKNASEYNKNKVRRQETNKANETAKIKIYSEQLCTSKSACTDKKKKHTAANQTQ